MTAFHYWTLCAGGESQSKGQSCHISTTLSSVKLVRFTVELSRYACQKRIVRDVSRRSSSYKSQMFSKTP